MEITVIWLPHFHSIFFLFFLFVCFLSCDLTSSRVELTHSLFRVLNCVWFGTYIAPLILKLISCLNKKKLVQFTAKLLIQMINKPSGRVEFDWTIVQKLRMMNNLLPLYFHPSNLCVHHWMFFFLALPRDIHKLDDCRQRLIFHTRTTPSEIQIQRDPNGFCTVSVDPLYLIR